MRLGSYEILSSLGRGGMGEVYRARDTALNRDIAIKVLLPAVANDPDRLARFGREAQVLASLNHPNIAHIYGLENEVGQAGPFLVMELAEGRTLADLIEQASDGLPLADALVIARQIAEALETAHDQRIIHRDLKPANIKVRDDLIVKVLDFGLAKAITGEAGTPDKADEDLANSPTMTAMTQAGVILGTAAYMSPEQAAGKPVDKRSDLWAFGVVLFEMLTGRRLFVGEDVSHVLASVLRDAPDWNALPADTPAHIRKLLRHCLEKTRRQRLDSATAARLEIEDALTSRADASAHTISGPPPSVGSWRRRTTMFVAFVLGAVLAGAAAVITVPRMEATRTGRSTDALSYVPLSFEPGGNTDAVWSPDGKGVAFAARQRDEETQQLYVRYLDSSTSTQLTHLDAPVWPIGWTTAGRIVFRTEAAPAGLWTISQTGGQPEPLLARAGTANEGIACSAGVSPDGSAVAFYDYEGPGRGGVWISEPAGSPPKPYAPSPFTAIAVRDQPKVRFSPDGKQLLLFLNGGHGQEAWVMPYPADAKRPPTRMFETMLRQTAGTPDVSWMPDNRRIIMAAASSTERSRLFVADTVSGEVLPLSAGTRPQIQPAVSPNGKRLVFTEATSDFDVVQLNLRTGDISPVIATPDSEDMPTWAMKAATMAYLTDRMGTPEIWLHQPGRPDRSVVTTRDFPSGSRLKSPTVSPDGTRIIFEVIEPAGAGAMWLVAVSGGAPVRVTNTRLDSLRERSGGWSPDGKWMVFLSGGEVRRVRTTGQATPEVLVRRPTLEGGLPVWSPNDDWILHNAGGWHLVSPDGKTERALSLQADVCAFSRNGLALYCVRNEGLGGILFSRPVADGPERVIAKLSPNSKPATQLNPGPKMTLTPDGEYVTYSVRKREANLWLMAGFH